MAQHPRSASSKDDFILWVSVKNRNWIEVLVSPNRQRPLEHLFHVANELAFARVAVPGQKGSLNKEVP